MHKHTDSPTYNSKLWIISVIITALFAICIIFQFMPALSGKNVTEGHGSDKARIAKFNIDTSGLSKTDLEITQGATDSTKITVYNKETETATEYYVEVTFPGGSDLPSDVTMNISYEDSTGTTKTVTATKKDGKYVFEAEDWVFQPSSIETKNERDLNLNFTLNSSAGATEEIQNISICVYDYQID